jgi:hypothetical protein
MKVTLWYIGWILVLGWAAFRITTWLWRRHRRRHPPPAPPVVCPKCGSAKVDDHSDAESGYCLDCEHVWGVEVPDQSSAGPKKGAPP